MKDGHDKKRDIPPIIDDPACAELAERFMRGETTVTNHHKRKKVWSSPPPQHGRKWTGVSARARKRRR